VSAASAAVSIQRALCSPALKHTRAIPPLFVSSYLFPTSIDRSSSQLIVFLVLPKPFSVSDPCHEPLESSLGSCLKIQVPWIPYKNTSPREHPGSTTNQCWIDFLFFSIFFYFYFFDFRSFRSFLFSLILFLSQDDDQYPLPLFKIVILIVNFCLLFWLLVVVLISLKIPSSPWPQKFETIFNFRTVRFWWAMWTRFSVEFLVPCFSYSWSTFPFSFSVPRVGPIVFIDTLPVLSSLFRLTQRRRFIYFRKVPSVVLRPFV